jgi:hypothetical protein
MITISEAIKTKLARMPFVEELLSENLINIMSLARKILPDIEELTMKEVTEETIAMAIRRLPKIAKVQGVKSIFAVAPDIMVRSHLCEFTVKKEGSQVATEKIVKTLSLAKEHFFTITQGVYEDTIIVSDVFERLVRSNLALSQILSFYGGLSSITIRLTEEIVEVPGVYYHILKSLAENGINVMEVVSTYREFTIIVREKDVDEAFWYVKRVFEK